MSRDFPIWLHLLLGAPVALLTLSAAALAQDPKLDSGLPSPPEQACYDVLSYDLALKVDPEKHTIDGTLGLRARILTALEQATEESTPRRSWLGRLFGRDQG